MITDDEILFPAKQYKVLDGRMITIRPWGMEQGMLLAPRVGNLLETLDASRGTKEIAKVIRDNQDEVAEVVRETIGWSTEEFNTLCYEDLFILAQGVIEVCLLRGKDMGGVVGKAIALGLPSRPKSGASASPEPSSSS